MPGPDEEIEEFDLPEETASAILADDGVEEFTVDEAEFAPVLANDAARVQARQDDLRGNPTTIGADDWDYAPSVEGTGAMLQPDAGQRAQFNATAQHARRRAGNPRALPRGTGVLERDHGEPSEAMQAHREEVARVDRQQDNRHIPLHETIASVTEGGPDEAAEANPNVGEVTRALTGRAGQGFLERMTGGSPAVLPDGRPNPDAHTPDWATEEVDPRAAVRSALQTISGENVDELDALAYSVVTGEDYGDAWEQAQATERNMEGQSPTSSTAGDVAGVAGLMALPGAAQARLYQGLSRSTVPGVMGRVGLLGAENAAYGMAHGSGASEHQMGEEGYAGDVAESGLVGFGGGVVAGTLAEVMPSTYRFLQRHGTRGADDIGRELSTIITRNEQIADEILTRSGGIRNKPRAVREAMEADQIVLNPGNARQIRTEMQGALDEVADLANDAANAQTGQAAARRAQTVIGGNVSRTTGEVRAPGLIDRFEDAMARNDAADAYTILDEMKRTLGRAQGGARGHVQEALRNRYERLMRVLMSEDLWGRGAVAIQRDTNPAWTQFINRRRPHAQRFLLNEGEAAMDGWENRLVANEGSVYSLARQGAQPEREQALRMMRNGLESQNDLTGALQRNYLGDEVTARLARESQSNTERAAQLVQRARDRGQGVAGAAATSLSNHDGLTGALYRVVENLDESGVGTVLGPVLGVLQAAARRGPKAFNAAYFVMAHRNPGLSEELEQAAAAYESQSRPGEVTDMQPGVE